MNNEELQEAIQLVYDSAIAFCHYITPNDVGATGGHQYGFCIAHSCYKVFFDEPGQRGANKDAFIEITWQNSIKTQSRAIYYGVGTRNEYRLTRFGRDFEFLDEKYIGSLLIIGRKPDGEYRAYVLSDQDNIEDFMFSFDLDITLGNQLIDNDVETQINNEFQMFIDLHSEFPETTAMAAFARDCVISANRYSQEDIANKADSVILKWIDAEYTLFRGLEEKIYRPVYSLPFANCQSLIDFSNTILNRRKSRAGKSLEHHLASIFSAAQVRFEGQVITENNKRPDFIFPDGKSYHDFLFPADKLTLLGAKTTCKDRWRQVLNEADRIEEKHLFTLQQGVTRNQLLEMRDEHLTLVVPQANLNLFLPEFHQNIMCLGDFINMVKERQNN